MYDLHDFTFPPRKPKKNPYKIITAILCVAALMLASGYVGARLATHAPTPEAAATQPPATPENNFDAMHIAAPGPVGEALSLPDLFDGANAAVVAISTEITGRNIFGQTITRPSAGSGFFVTADGYIVTNDHVIDNAASIMILMHDGTALPARVVGRAPESDLAVVKVEGSDFTHLVLGDSDALRVGEQVAAIGNPLGQLANSMTVGHISALDRNVMIDGTSHNKLQTDAAVNRGNSGGPLLNLYGEVIGIVSAKSGGTDVEGLGFAIPSSYARTIIDQLIEYGFVRGRAVLGVSIGIQNRTGALIITVVHENSAAQRAGLAVGDRLLSINGIELRDFAGFREILDKSRPNDEIVLRVVRDGVELAITATLDEYRPAGF